MTHLEGKRFGKLVAIRPTEKPIGVKDAHRYWLCQCDCGNTTVVSSSNLGIGTFSCGCGKRESKAKTHGCASHREYHRLYHIWNGIKFRCYNQKSKDFKNYGMRGIKMCDEWLRDFPTFQAWAMLNGYSEDLSIDRIDVNGNYEPSNCRWATIAEQNKNKRKKGNNA